MHTATPRDAAWCRVRADCDMVEPLYDEYLIYRSAFQEVFEMDWVALEG